MSKTPKKPRIEQDHHPTEQKDHPKKDLISIKNSLDPSSLLNPGKVYPILRKCAEEGRLHIHGRDKSKFSDIPRF